MNILYIGNSNPHSTSHHRASALERLGHIVTVINPYEDLRHWISDSLCARINWRSGYRFIQPIVSKWLASRIHRLGTRPDVVWVDSGELFGPRSVSLIRGMGSPTILYNIDDPTGCRDGARFQSLLASLPLYDLVALVRNESIAEARALGARNPIRVWRSYDEVAHAPFDDPSSIAERYISDVSFVGTWIRGEGREETLIRLIEAGMNVSIWGGRWQRSPRWAEFKSSWRGGSLGGRDYVAAMQGAKVSLGFLSQGNRDLHTTRSLEIPYAGGLLCAQRTVEHSELYAEGKEAILFDDWRECISACQELVSEQTLRESVRAGGMRKVRALRLGNEDVCSQILRSL